MSFTSLTKILKHLDKDQNHMSNSAINDSRLLLKIDRTRMLSAEEAISKMSAKALSHRSIITDPLKDVGFALNFFMNSQNNNETTNHNFITPSARNVLIMPIFLFQMIRMLGNATCLAFA